MGQCLWERNTEVSHAEGRRERDWMRARQERGRGKRSIEKGCSGVDIKREKKMWLGKRGKILLHVVACHMCHQVSLCNGNLNYGNDQQRQLKLLSISSDQCDPRRKMVRNIWFRGEMFCKSGEIHLVKKKDKFKFQLFGIGHLKLIYGSCLRRPCSVQA